MSTFFRAMRNIGRVLLWAMAVIGFVFLLLIAARSAKADDQPPCVPMSGPRDRILQAGGTWVQLSPAQWQFVRGIWVTVDGSHGQLPPGDKAFFSQRGTEADGTPARSDSVYFVDGDMVCDRLYVSNRFQQGVESVESGLIIHRGDKS